MQSTSLSHSPSQNCWRIEVAEKIPRRLAVDAAIVGGATDQGSVAPTLMESRVYYLKGGLDRDEVLDICRRLLCDPVVEKYEISGQQSAVSSEGSVPSPQSSVLSPQPPVLSPQSSVPSPQPFPTIEILPKPGVMDPVALSAERAIRDLGFDIQQVRTGRSYACANVSDPGVARRIAERALANTLIEEIHYSGFEEKYELRSTNYERRKKEEQGRPSGQAATWFDPFMETAPYQLEVKSVPICGADDRALLAVSSEGHLFLNIEEMQAIRAHYHRLEREPTDIELETFAQTWSEHCVHKTMRSEVRYRGADFPEELRITNYELRNPGSIEQKYGNLLADTIVAATRELNKPWCLSVFEDNAGIIEFDADHGIAFKVETHNHPTALAPYGGAATGIGGCIRDIMGCGLGAKPFANTDVFCFASPDLPHARLPAGVIHPARTMREVVRGVRDYGNRMGIPTVNGAIVFDDRYLGNPLVYCGCAGLIPKERIEKEAREGDRIVLVGGRTGRDGIHGATFSSGAMSGGHVDEFAHAVQIGNAITEKMVLDVLLQARDHERGCLYRSITDCGAGGLSSAVGEMAAELGAVVELDKVPLKYAGLRYDEIWISEAQERMVLAVAEENVDELLRLCRAEDVEATDIGCFGGDGELVLKYEGQVVGQLNVEFLHNGLPKTVREATWQPTNAADGAPVCESARAEACGSLTDDVRSALLDHLSSPNIASKEWVIRQYDHEVQGGSVIKPLMGPGRGPSDGAVVRPLLNSPKAVALSCGLCPHLSELDPYVMAIAAVDEAVRNNICVGGDMDRMAILDNFCWGDTSEPQVLGALVRAAQGCHDAALAFGIPFISGKDSLNNVFDLAPEEAQRLGWPERISVPGTLLISAISVVSDSARCRTSDLKEPGNKLLLVEPNGSRIVDLAAAARAVGQFLRAVEGLRSCHDVSEGGWLAAAAEMAIGSRYGLRLSRVDESFFDERLGCYLIEVRPDAVDGVAQHREVRVSEVGVVVEQPELRLDRDDGGVVWQVTELRRAWRQTFDWK